MLQFEIVSNDREQATFAERGPERWDVSHRGKEVREDILDDLKLAELFVAFLANGYDRFVLYLEDTILVSPSPGKVVCLDLFTGTTANADWTLEQVQAVCALALGGDEWPEPLLSQYYKIAEAAIANWPPQCRPIP